MVRAASLRGFTELVAGLGGDPAELLARFGIPPGVLADDDGLVPLTAHDLMLDAAADELGCPDLGLRLADAQDLSILGPLAVAVASSRTAGEAVDCASRFLFVHSPALRIALEPDPLGRAGVVAITYRKELAESPYSPQGIELGLGLLHRIAVALVGEVRSLRSVLVPHRPRSAVQRYVDFFGVDVRFGAPVAALRVERRILDEGFAGADAALRAASVAHLATRFRDPRLDLSARVRVGLAEALRTATPTVEQVASMLALHPRTLQRRLAAEGTTFGALLDEVRRDAAHRWLTTTDLPVAQVALMVGFAEQSSLSHACRRWFGASPRAVRGLRSRP